VGFEVIHSQTVFQGRVFDVRVDQVRLPDGRQIRVDIIEHRGAVTIIPVDSNGLVWFIRQYRHSIGEELVEFPAGVMEENESPDEAAQRELREEIGMAANSLKLIGEFFLAPGYSTEYMYVFLAEDLHPAPLTQDEGEMIEIEKVPVDKALDLAKQGKVRDAKSLASLFFWKTSDLH
jgi:ADP-ribose pyrophosphatase